MSSNKPKRGGSKSGQATTRSKVATSSTTTSTPTPSTCSTRPRPRPVHAAAHQAPDDSAATAPDHLATPATRLPRVRLTVRPPAKELSLASIDLNDDSEGEEEEEEEEIEVEGDENSKDDELDELYEDEEGDQLQDEQDVLEKELGQTKADDNDGACSLYLMH